MIRRLLRWVEGLVADASDFEALEQQIADAQECAKRLLGSCIEKDRRIDELLESNTKEVEARRAIDRAAMLAHAHRVVFDQPVRHVPQVPSDDEVRFRFRLMTEEYLESLRAAFTESKAEPWRFEEVAWRLRQIVDEHEVCVDLVELAREHADMKVILEGSDHAFGIPSHEVFAEVHRSNMKKGEGSKRADGKREKPPGWKLPDIEGVLRKAGWDGKDGKRR